MFNFFGAIFDFLVTIPCLNVLILLYRGVGDLGFALLLFSILLQVIFFPLTLYGMRSQRNMEVTLKSLQPQMEDLKKQYGDDKQKLRLEGQKLYKTYKINPAGGCLSIIIPLLFLGAMWFIFSNHLFSDTFHVQPGVLNHLLYPFNPQFTAALNTQLNWFGTYHLDLTRPEPGPMRILSIVAGVLALIQTKITLPGADLQAIIDNYDPALQGSSPEQTKVIMPFVVMVLTAASLWVLPVGMTFYWIVTSVIVISIQVYVNHFYTPSVSSSQREEKPVHEREQRITKAARLTNIRIFTALDMLRNPKLILAEFIFTIVLCGALGGFLLWRDTNHSLLTIVISFVFICVALNYVPLFFYAVSIIRWKSLRREIARLDKDIDLKRYMLPAQLLLFVPLSILVITLYQELTKGSRTP